MTNETTENKRNRDYSHEWNVRQKRQKRLVADLDRAKVQALQERLLKDGRTYANWLNEQIERELKSL